MDVENFIESPFTSFPEQCSYIEFFISHPQQNLIVQMQEETSSNSSKLNDQRNASYAHTYKKQNEMSKIIIEF
uniref:Uncharacterized protein n=1 Tax=Glossina brevipalpis TaxID=37001 RepID=A0A1A9WTN7_9MUSC